jgi:hypothetical protein
MPSTYTTNLGIEKIATGEQSGTWGTTTNTNFDLFDQAINGLVTVTAPSAGSSGSPNTLPITDGAVSDGRNAFIEINDGGDLGGDVFYQLTPNNAEKILYIRNSLTTQDLILFQGTYNASNDIVVPNGKDMLVKFSGTGAGATVTDVFNDLRATKIDPVTLSINGTAVSSTAAELNILDGVTSTAAELNILDGVTSTAAELNLVDGSSAGTIVNSKAVVYGAAGQVNATTLQIAGNSVTSTAAELNLVDGSSAGTIVNSKAVVYGAAGQVNATTLQIAGNSVTSTAAELNYLDIATLGTSAASKAITADADNETVISGAVRGTVTSVSSSSNVTTYDMNTTNNFSTTTTETTDITFSNETAGQSGNILFVNAGHVVSIDADVHMANGDLTAINVAGTYFLSYFCPDGTNVYLSATPAQTEGA